MYLLTKWFGTFIFDKKKIMNKNLFPNNPVEIAKRLCKIENNEILNEEKEISNNIFVIVNEERLQKLGEYIPEDKFFEDINIEPKKFGYQNNILHEASIILTRDKTNERLMSDDLQIIQMVNTLDDLIHTSNLICERINCWLSIKVSDEKIQPLKELLSYINKEIIRYETQIVIDVQKIAPNICSIVGPVISARLISLAGGIEKLAFMPSSSIQLLGAEKALFRFKKEGGKPPKHGIIYQHPLLNKSPKEIRGKISRILSTKIAIAAKGDVFTKRDLSNYLNRDLDNRIKTIKKSLKI